ncbi:MAG TPA: hypothetical protein VGZ47_22540 [Gemmataceae bacterium]|nr:hypothetical protein [Gemmataceae bacterium]
MQALYKRIRENLAAQRDHVARIVSGSACEQWFSSEAYVAVNWPNRRLLRHRHCALAEHRKRDLIIRDELERTIGTVESKMVYNNKNLWSALADLHRQLQRNHYEDEVPECGRAGLLYLVWMDCFARRDVKSLPDFHRAALNEIDRLFPAREYAQFPSKRFDEIVPITESAWPTGCFRLSLHMKLVQRTNR